VVLKDEEARTRLGTRKGLGVILVTTKGATGER
jgi:hypothetical protein